MDASADTLERELVRDLAALDRRFADEEFSGDLYRALTNNTWRKRGGPEGHVALSWNRAERVVNELRARQGQDPLRLAQTGSEGEVSDVVAEELERLGWTSRPLNTGRQDPRHVDQPGAPPPADQGERRAPAEGPGAWERQAHEEANRAPDPGAPVDAQGGTGAGGGNG